MLAIDINQESVIQDSAHWICRLAVVVIAMFFGTFDALAQSDVIRLIPLDAPVIAGMRRAPHDQINDNLWLATKNNREDLNELITLTASDPARRFDEVIVTDSAMRSDGTSSHLLLAVGKFDIARTTTRGFVTKYLVYKNMPVLAIESDIDATRGVRWLAVPRQDLAVLGDPTAVQQALDRFLNHSPADPGIEVRVGRFHAQDTAWSSLKLSARQIEAQLALHASNDVLLSSLRQTRELDLHIELGSKVKIEIGADSDSADQSSEAVRALRAVLVDSGTPVQPIALSDGAKSYIRVAMKREAYERWLDTFRRTRMKRLFEAALAAGGQSSDSGT